MTNAAQPKDTSGQLSLTVFCGSSKGANPAHLDLAKRVGLEIAQRGDRLVYGGGGLGLMGMVARTVHENGGDVLGIIPNFLSEAERALTIVEHEFTPDMHSRKLRLYAEGDAFIVMPGGIGTLEEAVEVLSWMRLNLHDKPIVFLSDIGYWDTFMAMMRQIIDEEFAPKSLDADIMSATSIKQAYGLIEDRLANPTPRKALNLREASIEDLV